MALFQYFALTANGKKTVGLINADSLELAKELLLKQQILVTKLSIYKKQTRDQKLPSSLVLNLTRDLHILLRAGLPLYESLLTAKEKYFRTKVHSLLLNLCDQVKKGKHLSDILAEYPLIFNAVYISMIRSGEESGSLTKSFEELSTLISRSQEIKKKVSAAMIYPIFLGSFCLLVIGVLLFFLIPSMKELFEGRSLHPLTATILNISTFLNENALWIGCSFIGLLLSAIIFMKQKVGKLLLHKFTLHMPVLKRLTTEAVLSRFCRIFSVLLHGGVPLLDALKLAKLGMNHTFFETTISEVEGKVIEGKRLSIELKKSPFIPPLIIRMMAIAEESGNMSKMMQHVSEIYEEDLQRSLIRLTAFLQPVILLFLGIVVAVVLLSVLLPLTDVSSVIQ